MGDSKIPSRKRSAKIPPKLVVAAVQREQVPKPSIMSGMIRAAEYRLATE